MLFGGTIVPEHYFDEQRRDKISELIQKDFDIVCLCEVWSDKYKNLIIENVKNVFPYWHYPKKREFEMGSGLLVLSKYEITDTNFEEYVNVTGQDRVLQKGIMQLIFKYKKNQEFKIVFTHDQSGMIYFQPQRAAQFEQGFNAIKKFRSDVSPTIYGGDLNIFFRDNYTKEYDYLIELFQGYKDSMYPDIYWYTYDTVLNFLAKMFGYKEPPERHDVMMVSNEFDIVDHGMYTNWVLDFDPLIDTSDHYPIWSIVRLKD